MEKHKTWRQELADHGLLYGIVAGIVCAFCSLARLTHLMGASLLTGILIITTLRFIDHLA